MKRLSLAALSGTALKVRRRAFASENSKRRCRNAGIRVAVAAALFGLATTAHATNYNEGPVVGGPTAPHEIYDLSSTSSAPTDIGALTLGSNFIVGETIPYGPIVNARTGERQFEDDDYVTFTVPNGDVLSSLYLVAPSTSVLDGTTINLGDRVFIGIASGGSVNVTPPSSAGLLGFTLASSSMIGSDILPALGMSAPPGFAGPPFSGATTFSGPLPSGVYSLWLVDGDNPVSYNLDLRVSAAPEPGSWVMLLAGFGVIGAAMRIVQGRRRENEMKQAVIA